MQQVVGGNVLVAHVHAAGGAPLRCGEGAVLGALSDTAATHDGLAADLFLAALLHGSPGVYNAGTWA